MTSYAILYLTGVLLAFLLGLLFNRKMSSKVGIPPYPLYLIILSWFSVFVLIIAIAIIVLLRIAKLFKPAFSFSMFKTISEWYERSSKCAR